MKIGVSNLKGGVGKTTISQNLAVCFAQMGFKTCIVDTDENQNSLAWSGVRPAELPPITVVGITDVMALAKRPAIPMWSMDSLFKSSTAEPTISG